MSANEVTIVTVDVPYPVAVLGGVRIPTGVLVSELRNGAALRVTAEREQLRQGLLAAGMPSAEVEELVAGARFATLGHAFAVAPTGAAATYDDGAAAADAPGED